MEPLTALNVGVSLYTVDVEWMRGAYGEDWPQRIRDLVHEQIRKIEVWAKIDRMEAKLTQERKRSA